MSDERILVLGVGNALMGDDGLGPRVVELLLTGYEFPPNVEVVDSGTMSFMIIDVIRDADRLIVVDAVKETGQPAGTVFRMTPDEIAPNSVYHSLHDTRLIDVLQAIDLMGSAPDTIAFGVQIDSIDEWVLELSEPVAAAVPIAAGAVLDELASLGVAPAPRDDSDVHAQVIEALRTYEPMPGPTFQE